MDTRFDNPGDADPTSAAPTAPVGATIGGLIRSVTAVTRQVLPVRVYRFGSAAPRGRGVPAPLVGGAPNLSEWMEHIGMDVVSLGVPDIRTLFPPGLRVANRADEALVFFNNCVGTQAITNAQRLGAMLKETAPAVRVVEPVAPRQASLFGDE